jgi:hypothetical protein
MTPLELGLEENVLVTLRFAPGTRDYVFMIPMEAFNRLKERAAREQVPVSELLEKITLNHLQRPFTQPDLMNYPTLKKPPQHTGCGFDIPIQRRPKNVHDER